MSTLPLWNHGSVLVVDFAIAPVGLGAHGPEPPAEAECGLKTVASRLLYDDRNPCVGIGRLDNVRVVDLDELQEVGEDYLLRPLESLLSFVEDLDAVDFPGKVWISSYLYS
jgi:hypothetical protein